MSIIHSETFILGITTGIAICTVGHYLFSSVKDCVSLFYPLSTPVIKTLQELNNLPYNTNIPKDFHSPARNTPSPQLTPLPQYTVHEEVLHRLEDELTVSSAKLSKMVKHMVSEMKKGLKADGQNLKMIPSYVVDRPTGNETGHVLALDLGGSNFRVCLVKLEGQGMIRMRQRKYVVSEELKKGSGEQLFDFFADSVGTFLADEGLIIDDKPLPLGFTFSFPVKQTAIDEGILMHWNKGFTCSGVVSEDVGKLLHEALIRRDINVKVKAIVNDTVGTLMTHAYNDPQTYIGVILGTGTNAAYVEKLKDIEKCNLVSHSGEMIINTEWGAYNEASVLPITKYDRILDRASSNSKSQIFEKMISGMYLGEITRLICMDLIFSGELFCGEGSKELSTQNSFDTAFMSRIERDHTLDLRDTKSLLEDILGIKTTSLNDRRLVKKVCELVGTRSARLSAAGVAAIVTKINCHDACTVAIDGSLFEHYPHYGNRMRDALRDILGIISENILLEQARDGSGQGAAIIAALHQ